MLSLRIEKADDELIQAIAKGVAPKLSDADTRFISTLPKASLEWPCWLRSRMAMVAKP